MFLFIFPVITAAEKKGRQPDDDDDGLLDEEFHNGRDDDGDGRIDCQDTDCNGHQAGVVVSIFSQHGVRQQPLRGGLHWVVPLAERVVVMNQGAKLVDAPTEEALSDQRVVDVYLGKALEGRD